MASRAKRRTPDDSYPSVVRNALKRIPEVTQPLFERWKGQRPILQADQPLSLSQLSIGELRAINQQLQPVLDHLKKLDFGTVGASAVLADHKVHISLLQLTGAALRTPTSELDWTRSDRKAEALKEAVAATVYTSVWLLKHGKSAPRPGAAPLHAFGHALVRTHALPAASCRLAEVAEHLALWAAAAAEHNDSPQQQEPSVTAVPAAASKDWHGKPQPTAAKIQPLASMLQIFVQDLVSCTGRQLLRTPEGEWTPDTRQQCEELASSLHESHALEHSARVALLRLHVLSGGQPSPDLDYLHGQAAGFSSTCTLLMCVADFVGGILRWSGLAKTLQATLCGQCVQAMALSLGMPVLCAIDLGSAYGMPGFLQAGAAAGLLQDGSDGRSPAVSHIMESSAGSLDAGSLLEAMPVLLALKDRTGPPGRRGARAVALRVGRAALAAAQASGAPATPSGPPGGGGGRTRQADAGLPTAAAAAAARAEALLAKGDALPVVSAATQAAKALLLPAVGSERWLAEAEEFWRLAVEAVGARGLLQHTDENGALLLALRLRWWEATVQQLQNELTGLLCLPPSPPAEVAAALAGGLLPCLERLLRRAGQAPSGQEARVFRCLLAGDKWSMCCYLAPLLAHGDPAQAASLVATLGKLLRLVDPGALLAARWQPSEDTVQGIVHAAIALLRAPLDSQAFLLPAPPDGPSRTSQQLVRLLSIAACHWLPPLSRLALQALQLRGPQIGGFMPDILAALLGWLPFLATRCGAASGGPGAATASAACSGGGGGEATCSAAPATADADTDAALQRHAAIGETGGATAAAPGSYTGEGSVPCAADAGGWRVLLLEEVDAVALLGATLELAQGLAEAEVCVPNDVAADFLVRLVQGSGAVMAVVAGQGGVASALSYWRPELLRAMAERLREYGELDMAVEVEALEAQLQNGGRRGAPLLPPPARSFAAALLPPSEARCLLRTCGNPGCANLGGDSEAGLSLKACSGCGVAGYCGRDCQTAHWRAGHREECAGRS